MHTRRRVTFVMAGLVMQGGSAAAQAAGAPTCLAALHGTWRGPGTVLGRPVVMEQRWAPAMLGSFTELTMRHLASDTSRVAQFEGRGFYRTQAADSVTGTWFDARGVTYGVRGACHDGAFSSTWTGGENGRTRYLLRGPELTVIDSVYPASGSPREFGRSVLRRVASP